MSEQEFFGYQDIGEKGFIKWTLDYTFEPIISDFLRPVSFTSICPARFRRRLRALDHPIFNLGRKLENDPR